MVLRDVHQRIQRVSERAAEHEAQVNAMFEGLTDADLDMLGPLLKRMGKGEKT